MLTENPKMNKYISTSIILMCLISAIIVVSADIDGGNSTIIDDTYNSTPEENITQEDNVTEELINDTIEQNDTQVVIPYVDDGEDEDNYIEGNNSTVPEEIEDDVTEVQDEKEVITPEEETPEEVIETPVDTGCFIRNLQVTEIMPLYYGREYFQVTNYGDYPVDLQGWKILTGCGLTLNMPSVVIEPGHSLVVYTGDGTDREDILFLKQPHHLFRQHDTVTLFFESSLSV